MSTAVARPPAGNSYRVRHLYAVAFADGVIKIGYTGKPRTRVTQLASTRGIPIVRWHFSCPTEYRQAQLREKRLITAVGRIGNALRGRLEFFHDVRFSVAKQLVDQICRTPPEPAAQEPALGPHDGPRTHRRGRPGRPTGVGHMSREPRGSNP